MMGSRYSALPSELKLWHGLGVELDEKIPSDLRNCTYKTIGQYKKLWEYLYTAVFSAQSSLIQSKINSLDIDDQTHVIIFRRIPGTLVFECKIVNDEVEGTATSASPRSRKTASRSSSTYTSRPSMLTALTSSACPNT